MADDHKLFRFEHLEVWQRAADVVSPLGRVADHLTERHLYRYAEQLCGAGSNSKTDFRNFLNIAHRSAFECTNMLLDELDQICRMITSFSRSLD
jgi:hypothetical protein